MPYMNCLRCGLRIKLRASFLTLDLCPRCLGRAGVPVPMYVSDQPPVRPVPARADAGHPGHRHA